VLGLFDGFEEAGAAVAVFEIFFFTKGAFFGVVEVLLEVLAVVLVDVVSAGVVVLDPPRVAGCVVVVVVVGFAFGSD
jgi:hypothetical protein